MIFVDFPAALPVDEIKVEALIPYSKEAFIQFNQDGLIVKIVGNKYLADSKVQSLFTTSKSITEGLNALRRAYVEAGHLLMKVDFFRNDQQIIFLVREMTLDNVTGDSTIVSYFDALKGEANLTYDEYEVARVRAETFASRSGLNYKASYKSIGEKGVTLNFVASTAENFEPTQVFVEANNHGSRYSGEYNAKIGFSQYFDQGNRLTLVYGAPLASLNDEDTGELSQVLASFDMPTPYGTFGIDAVAVDYQRDQVGNDAAYEGTLNMVTLRGGQIVASDRTSRFSIQGSLSHIDDSVNYPTAPDSDNNEKYLVGELGLTYNKFARGDYSFTFSAAAKVGLTQDAGGSFATDKTDPAQSATLSQTRQSEFTTFKPQLAFVKKLADRFELSMNYMAQTAKERVPQAQQFVLGGTGSMSAWLPGVMIGDEGYHAKLALGYSFNAFGGQWKASVFTEKGETQYINADDNLKQSATDSGIALTGQFGKQFTFNLIAARADEQEFYSGNTTNAAEKETNVLGQFIYRF
jgi:hypothetical protein